MPTCIYTKSEPVKMKEAKNSTETAIESPSDKVEIAILDDDLDFRNYLEDVLASEGSYQVHSFG